MCITFFVILFHKEVGRGSFQNISIIETQIAYVLKETTLTSHKEVSSFAFQSYATEHLLSENDENVLGEYSNP